MGQFTKNRNLDGVRGLAIVFVIFCHFFAHASPNGNGVAISYAGLNLQNIFLRLGSVGVNLFFTLSAYLLTKNFKEKRYRNLREYLAKRFLRIYPAFIIFTLIYVILYALFGKYKFASEIDPGYLAVCIFFLQPLFIGTNINSIDVVPGTWSLYPEIYFYLFLPLMLHICRKFKNQNNFLIACAIFALLFRSNVYGSENWALSRSVLFHFDAFVAGIILANRDIDKTKSVMSEKIGWIIIFISISGIFPIEDPRAPLSLTIGVYTVIQSLVFRDKGWLVQSRLLQNIGVRSYGLFLSHIGVYWYVSIPILDERNIQDYSIRFCIGGLIAIVISYILSDVSFRFFENQRVGKKKKSQILMLTFLSISAAILISFSV